MKPGRTRVGIACVIAALLLGACGGAPTEEECAAQVAELQAEYRGWVKVAPVGYWGSLKLPKADRVADPGIQSVGLHFKDRQVVINGMNVAVLSEQKFAEDVVSRLEKERENPRAMAEKMGLDFDEKESARPVLMIEGDQSGFAVAQSLVWIANVGAKRFNCWI